VDRVSSCSRKEGESARCCRVSLGSSSMISFCRPSFGCSSMISFCRRVSDCEELKSDKLEGAEESDIVKI